MIVFLMHTMNFLFIYGKLYKADFFMVIFVLIFIYGELENREVKWERYYLRQKE